MINVFKFNVNALRCCCGDEASSFPVALVQAGLYRLATYMFASLHICLNSQTLASLCSLALITLKSSVCLKRALPFFPTVAKPSYLYCRAEIVVHPILVSIVIVRKLYWPSLYQHVLSHLAAAHIELFFHGALKMFSTF